MMNLFLFGTIFLLNTYLIYGVEETCKLEPSVDSHCRRFRCPISKCGSFRSSNNLTCVCVELTNPERKLGCQVMDVNKAKHEVRPCDESYPFICFDSQNKFQIYADENRTWTDAVQTCESRQMHIARVNVTSFNYTGNFVFWTGTFYGLVSDNGTDVSKYKVTSGISDLSSAVYAKCTLQSRAHETSTSFICPVYPSTIHTEPVTSSNVIKNTTGTVTTSSSDFQSSVKGTTSTSVTSTVEPVTTSPISITTTESTQTPSNASVVTESVTTTQKVTHTSDSVTTSTKFTQTSRSVTTSPKNTTTAVSATTSAKITGPVITSPNATDATDTVTPPPQTTYTTDQVTMYTNVTRPTSELVTTTSSNIVDHTNSVKTSTNVTQTMGTLTTSPTFTHTTDPVTIVPNVTRSTESKTTTTSQQMTHTTTPATTTSSVTHTSEPLKTSPNVSRTTYSNATQPTPSTVTYQNDSHVSNTATPPNITNKTGLITDSLSVAPTTKSLTTYDSISEETTLSENRIPSTPLTYPAEMTTATPSRTTRPTTHNARHSTVPYEETSPVLNNITSSVRPQATDSSTLSTNGSYQTVNDTVMTSNVTESVSTTNEPSTEETTTANPANVGTNEASKDQKDDTVIIAGAVSGGVVLLIIVATVVYVMRKRSTSHSKTVLLGKTSFSESVNVHFHTVSKEVTNPIYNLKGDNV